MSQVLHRKLRCLLDCTLPAGGSATEHMSARIGVLACFSPGSGPRSARMRGLQDRPRGGVRKWRERKAESGSGPQGWVRETGKSAGEHGPLGPLPSVKVRRSVRGERHGKPGRVCRMQPGCLRGTGRLQRIGCRQGARWERYRRNGGGRFGDAFRSRGALPARTSFGRSLQGRSLRSKPGSRRPGFRN